MEDGHAGREEPSEQGQLSPPTRPERDSDRSLEFAAQIDDEGRGDPKDNLAASVGILTAVGLGLIIWIIIIGLIVWLR